MYAYVDTVICFHTHKIVVYYAKKSCKYPNCSYYMVYVPLIIPGTKLASIYIASLIIMEMKAVTYILEMAYVSWLTQTKDNTVNYTW